MVNVQILTLYSLHLYCNHLDTNVGTDMTTASLFRMFSSDLAIDLGTANTLVFERNKGIVVNEPSIVAMRKDSSGVEAVGTEAREMIGRTPERITAIRPMKNGVIADFEATSHMLNHFIHKAHRYNRVVHPRIVIGVPSEITPVERRAVKEACSKASEVYLVQQPVMAAVGAGLPIAEPVGNLIVDIGGGTTDVAVISLAGVVYAHSVRVAGNAMDEVIIDHVKRKHNLLIGERTAEAIKIEIGSAFPLANEMRMEVRGRDLVRGLPGAVTRHRLRNPRGAVELRGEHRERDQSGAGTHTARAQRRHLRSRPGADRRRRPAEESQHAHPQGNRTAGIDRGRPPAIGGGRRGQDAG